MKKPIVASGLTLAAALAVAAVNSGEKSVPQPKDGIGKSFLPDHFFSGSSLDGWHSVGAAGWQAEDGEITGKATTGSAPGLLVLDRKYQDSGFRALVKSTPDAEAGVIFRMEKKGEETTGYLVSIAKEETTLYRIAFDSQGKEVKREPLRRAGGMTRNAPRPDPSQDGNRGGGGGGRRPDTGPDDRPLVRPDRKPMAGEWNQLEVFLDLDILRAHINDSGEVGGATDDDGNGYGSIALYVGGSGQASFKEIGYKDIARLVTPVEETSERFRVQRINDMYYAWAAASADFDKDGNTDVVAGPYIHFGPEFTVSREIYPAVTFSPAKEFTAVNCQYTHDFNGDGWEDVLVGPPIATLYLNPKGESRRWEKSVVVPSVQTEVTVFEDIDKDGAPELVFGTGGRVCYAKFDPADPGKPWTVRNVSAPGYSIAHGLGVGDINSDGRPDILNPFGWWEQPAAADSEWTYHAQAFARYGHRSNGVGGCKMGVYDVNGDGLNDVVTALNAHGFGLAWFEQRRDTSGAISFAMHMISDDYSTKNPGDVTFSQPHGATFGDVDGDGLTDFIVGKRYWSHLSTHLDPDPYGAPVVYWYRTVRNPAANGGAEFVPELIHNRSGVGSDVLAADLNKDGSLDVVTSTDRGTFIFWNQKPAK